MMDGNTQCYPAQSSHQPTVNEYVYTLPKVLNYSNTSLYTTLIIQTATIKISIVCAPSNYFINIIITFCVLYIDVWLFTILVILKVRRIWFLLYTSCQFRCSSVYMIVCIPDIIILSIILLLLFTSLVVVLSNSSYTKFSLQCHIY